MGTIERDRLELVAEAHEPIAELLVHEGDRVQVGQVLLRQTAGALSGGQKQRLALAATTLHEPELLLLDEPTSAVDPQSRRDYWESLFELIDAGTTILVSTHFMDEAERCHQLAILDEGKLVARDTAKQLIKKIGVQVVKVETERSSAARSALLGAMHIKTVTQLGSRLHVLVESAVADAVGHVRGLLTTQGVAAELEVISASLEDVFVVATDFGKNQGAARQGL